MTQHITEPQLKTARTQAFEMFSALYLLDASELQPLQQAEHARQLAAAHALWAKLENAKLEDLNARSSNHWAVLQSGLAGIQTQVGQGAKPADVLAMVGGVMDSLSTAVKGLFTL